MNLKQRLVMLLSEPEVSDSEFRNVKKWLQEGGVGKILLDAETIRHALRSYQSRAGTYKPPLAPSSDDSFVSELDQLLRSEAGMTVKAALEELMVRTSFPGLLPERISFAAGVQRIRKVVGESRVLSAAHQIRNEGVHQSSKLAWPLTHDR